MRRLWSLFAVLCLIVSALPVSPAAAQGINRLRMMHRPAYAVPMTHYNFAAVGTSNSSGGQDNFATNTTNDAGYNTTMQSPAVQTLALMPAGTTKSYTQTSGCSARVFPYVLGCFASESFAGGTGVSVRTQLAATPDQDATRIIQLDSGAFSNAPQIRNYMSEFSKTASTNTDYVFNTNTVTTGSASALTDIFGTVFAQSALNGRRIKLTNQTVDATHGANGTYLGNGSGVAMTLQSTSTSGSLLDMIDAFSGNNVVSTGRFMFWHASPTSGYFKVTDHMAAVKLAAAMIWHDYPGHIADNGDCTRAAIPKNSREVQDQANNLGGFSDMTAQKSDHMDHNMDAILVRCIHYPFIQSIESGAPYFPSHRYFSNASTAQTINGVVTTFRYTGSLTGWHLRLLNRDKSPNADFKIDDTGAVTRKSSTIIKVGRTDLILDVYSDLGYHFYTPQWIDIGSLNKCACDTLTLDGNEWAVIWGLDNAGTAAEPIITDNNNGACLSANSAYNTTGNLFGIPCGQTEWSFAIRVKPSASYTGVLEYILNAGMTIWIDATGKVKIGGTNDAGSFIPNPTNSTSTTCNTGLILSSCNARWLLYSGSTTNNRQRLMIVDDVTGNLLYDSVATYTMSGLTSLKLNPRAHNVLESYVFSVGVTSSVAGPAPISNATMSANFAGDVARFMMWNKEIDWNVGGCSTVGSSCASTNLALLRSGAGTLTDFSSATVGSDGRTLSITGGVAGTYSGNLAPFFMLSGNAGDFMHGINAGTGAYPFDTAEEPNYPALVGAYGFNTADHHDYQGTGISSVGYAVNP